MKLLKYLMAMLVTLFVLFAYGFVFPYMVSAEDSMLAFGGVILTCLFTVGLLYFVGKFVHRFAKEHC